MAEVWEPDYTHRGYWSSATDWVEGDFRTENSSFPARNYQGFIRWPGPNAPLDNIESATLTGTRVSGTRNMAVSVYRGDAPAPPFDRPDSTSLRLIDTTSGSSFQWDVTDELVDALEGTDWTPGDAIAIHGEHSGTPGITTWDLELSITYALPVQYLAPVTVPAAVAVGPVEFTFSLTPATVQVPAVVTAVDVVAPRVLYAEPTTATVTTGTAAISGTGQAPPLDMAARLHVPVTVGVALLSLTIAPAPPPIPWRRLIESPLYREALDSREPVTDARVEILSPDGAVIATLGGPDATHPGVVGGSVTCRGGDAIRWECDLTFDNPDLVPLSHHDLLHPLSHNAVRVWWRILLADSTWGEIPVGTYYLDWPAVSDNGDGSISLTARGADPVAEVKRARYKDPINIGGMTAHDAVRTILEDRAPWAALALTPSTYRLAKDYEAGEPGGDPVDDIMRIAQAAGMEFYADRMGVLTLADQPEPGSAVEAFIEGPGCAMTEISASIDLDNLLNSVTVASTVTQDEDGNEIEPVSAHVQDDDATSPLWVGRGRIRHRRIEHDYIETEQQARNVARRTLDEHRAAVDQIELITFARPHLDPGDVIAIQADRARITGSRQVTGWSLALGDLSGQRISAAGRRGLS